MAGGSRIVIPGGFDLADVVECLADQCLSLSGEEDDSRSSVGGIGGLYTQRQFKGMQRVADRLMPRPRARGEGW